MALLNRELNLGFKYLRPDRTKVANPKHMVREHTDSMMYFLRNWDDHDYFYVEIFLGNAFDIFPIETVVPEDILEKIRTDKKTFLYVCNTHEAFLHIVEPLYESLVVDAGIPPKKIYISNEAPDLYRSVQKYADANGFEYMNVEWILEFEYSTSIQANDLNLDGSTMLLKKEYPKRYLNFNRRWRLHRPTLVALLKAKKLLDKGYVSLAPSDDHEHYTKLWNWILSHHSKDPEVMKLLTEHEQEILEMGPLYLDTDELYSNRADLEQISLSLYENSLVSIVTETTFYQGEPFNSARFLSEKIFKPIAVGHPFIFVTVPKGLEILRTLGYKTFHPYINEDYDNEFEDITRLKCIIKEIERISNFSRKEISEFIRNVKPICDFNQQVIKEKTRKFRIGEDPGSKIIHDYFVKKML